MVRRSWWWAVLSGGVVLRLLSLAAAPFNVAELRAAWAALALVHGQAGGMETPLLTLGNAGLFALLGAGEGVARVLPALAGSALLFIPWLWRRRLGELEALVATALLALSPLALSAARRVNGEVLGVLGAALVWTALLALETSRERRLALGAGLALGLGGASAFYDGLLGGVLAWLITRWAFPEEAVRWRLRVDRLEVVAGLIGVGCMVLLSWVAGLGMSAPFEGLAAWLRSWSAARATYLLLWPLLYEPLTLFLVLLTLGRALRQPSPWAVFTWLWAFGAFLLVVLRPGAAPLALAGCVLPLALMAGQVVADIPTTWKDGTLGGEGAHALVTWLLWMHAGQALGRHTTYLASGVELGIVVLVLAMQGLLVYGFGLILPEKGRSWRGLWLGTAATLLLLQSSTALAVAFWRADNPNEPLTGTVVARDLVSMRETLLAHAGHTQDVALTLVGTEASDALLAARWVLRDVATQPAVSWNAVTTPYALALEGNASPAGWLGRTYVALLGAPERVPGCTQTQPPICQYPLGWYLYRQNPLPYARARVALWLGPQP